MAFIRKLNRDGHTIILTTHYLEEAEALCSRIAMLKAGRVVALDSTQNLLSRFPGITCRVAAARLPEAWRARVVREERGVFHIALESYAELESLLAALRAEGIAIDELALEETDLEQVFLKIMREGADDVSSGSRSPEAIRPRLDHAAPQGAPALLEGGFQTIAAPVLTSLLYLLIFSHVLEGRVSVYDGRVTYTAFLVPGLVMMSVLQNAFANSSSSLIQSKITGNLIFVLLPPLSALDLFAAYVLGAMVRGIVVGRGRVRGDARLRAGAPRHAASAVGARVRARSAAPSSAMLGCSPASGRTSSTSSRRSRTSSSCRSRSCRACSTRSTRCRRSGRRLSHFNPFFYMIDGFRYGFFGVSDISPAVSFGIVGGRRGRAWRR